ncbi:hypothetical protein DL96DRAFT_1766248 [Flagelloscypha sp. PMI_526]|nr:hypothetical protein DL96DRAFT_1766248 [Flagelloscypha sp. PMI_526]
MPSSSAETVGPFSFGERLGLLFEVQIAFLSATSVLCVIIWVLRSISISAKHGYDYKPLSHPIGLQFMSLLVFDLIQSTGAIFHIPWIARGHIDETLTCTLQGMFQHIGEVGVAMTTTMIAIHTFLAVAFNIELRTLYAQLIVTIGFAMGARADLPSIYGDTGFWCWIRDDFYPERVAFGYMWIWIAGLTSLLSYGCMALIVRGNLVFVNGLPKFQRRHHRNMLMSSRNSAMVWKMLFYPAIYLACITPISIFRFMSFSGVHVPDAGTFFSSCLSPASGFFNSLLFAFTRPSLSPQAALEKTTLSSDTGSMSDGAPLNKSWSPV